MGGEPKALCYADCMTDIIAWATIVAAAHVGLTWAWRRGIGRTNPIWAELCGLGSGFAVAALYVGVQL